ncbi:MAG: hypothetical protein KUG77_10735 [Nannocystaceae bacterium]|nr:hypothetical protein [Nannocystaceae bacterium]
MQDETLVRQLDRSGALGWVAFEPMLDLLSAVSMELGASEVAQEYERAVTGLVASPILAPLIKPLVRILGARTMPVAFPRGWAMLTRDVARVESWIDESASWLRFHDVPEEIAAHPMLEVALTATIRAVVKRVDPDSRVWMAAEGGPLTIGTHSPSIRASSS